eukprot:CAMPEP_0118940212 /NCGR_PEP_ID=MMETSP1169-20130426/30855_1 /TAXON_ID=36882 /ORGANISM="Pyramimonas obovata, Strain CCMP722" /LENGTH=65 /DNA_ID=CAMNT_0006884641 /DNA_START=20 /DNA_END=214 /DNA_ORIENTATION=+
MCVDSPLYTQPVSFEGPVVEELGGETKGKKEGDNWWAFSQVALNEDSSSLPSGKPIEQVNREDRL